MEEGAHKRKIKPGRADTEVPQGAATDVVAQAQQASSEVSKEVTDELSRLIQDLLLKAHELSFEYSTMECDEILSCPLAKKAKELFRIIKQLSEMSRRMVAPPGAQYVR